MSVDHQNRKHSRISPSGLKSLQLCPGYENDGKESAAANRGTFLHQLMETYVIPDEIPEGVTGQDLELAAKMIEHLQEEDKLSDYEPLNEIKLDFTSLNLKDFNEGHLDRMLVIEATDEGEPLRAKVRDFKFGQWEVDPIPDNLQFKAYTVGAMLAFPTLDEVEFILDQPALGDPVSHTFRRSQFNLMVSQIGAIVKRRHKWLETKDATMLRSDTDNCGFCAIQEVCPIWQAYMVKVANESNVLETTVLPIDKLEDPTTVDPDELVRVYRWIRPLEEYLKKMKRFALAAYDSGIASSQFTLTEKVGSQTVIDPIAVRDILAEYGVSELEFLSACDISVGSIRKLVEEKAARGDKAKTGDAALDQIRDQGLIQDGYPVRYVQLSRKKK